MFSDAGGVIEASRTLVEVNGPVVILVLVIPALVAALPFVARRVAIRATLSGAAGTALTLFSIVTGFSIGMFYLPSAVLLVAASAASVAAAREAAYLSGDE